MTGGPDIGERLWYERFLARILEDARTGDPGLRKHIAQIERWERTLLSWPAEDSARHDFLRQIDAVSEVWLATSRHHRELEAAASDRLDEIDRRHRELSVLVARATRELALIMRGYAFDRLPRSTQALPFELQGLLARLSELHGADLCQECDEAWKAMRSLPGGPYRPLTRSPRTPSGSNLLAKQDGGKVRAEHGPLRQSRRYLGETSGPSGTMGAGEGPRRRD